MSRRLRKTRISYENDLLQENEDPPHIIYARRSEEEDEKQKASIPQQIERCKIFAERNQVNLALRSKDCPIDEQTITEIKEDNQANLEKAHELIAFYKKCWVVTERKSAKIPFRREKWSSIIKLIEKRKIKGLLGYSPDRLSRNVQEGGELIQLVDHKYVRLKFDTFHFEDNAAGHMMLGIWFVFAEHYSRKLSEDSTRGTKKKHVEGKALGVRKYGYGVDDNDYFIPDEFHFPILRKAFERKMFDKWSDPRIAEEMNKLGWNQKLKNRDGQSSKMTAKKISEIGLWTDPFYYGVFQRVYKNGGMLQIDLRTLDGYNFIPVVSEEEWDMLQEQLTGCAIRDIRCRQSRKGKELDPVKPIPDGMFKLKDGHGFNFTLPNRRRDFEPKLKEGKSLADVVNPTQIRYRYQNIGKGKGLEFKWSEIDTFIAKEFQNIEISEEDYQAYLYVKIEDIKNTRQQRSNILSTLRLRIGKLNKERDEFYDQTNAGIGLTGKQKDFWEKKDRIFEARIKELEAQKLEINEDTRDIIAEERNFFDLIRNLPVLWEKSSYVQKREILEILVLNITSDTKKELSIGIKPELATLFIRSGAGCRIDFEHFHENFLLIPKSILNPILKFQKEKAPLILEAPESIVA